MFEFVWPYCGMRANRTDGQCVTSNKYSNGDPGSMSDLCLSGALFWAFN